MKQAGKVHTACFVLIEQMLQEQKHTLKEINIAVEKYIADQWCTPTFKGYSGYPDALCMSVDDEIVHTIPDDRILKEGHIVSVDLGVRYQHMAVDSGKTIYIGDHTKMPKDTRRLLEWTYKSLLAGIEACKTAKTIGDISHAIGKVAKEYKLWIIEELCGHGTGYDVHEDPYVENDGRAGSGPKIQPGLVIAIEPILTLGKPRIVELDDGWNIVTADGKSGAQFEHNVFFTEKGPVIVTDWGIPEWIEK